MPLDPSLLAGQPVAPLGNPLEMLRSMAGIQGQSIQNQLAGQTLKAQQAVGAGMQGAVNPLTGEFDPEAASKAINSNPDAAILAPETNMRLLDLQQKKAESQLKTADLVQKRMELKSQFEAPLLQLGDGITLNDVKKAYSQLDSAVGDPTFSKKLAGFLSTAPEKGPALQAAIKKSYETGLSISQQAETMFSTPQVLNAGGMHFMGQPDRVSGTLKPVMWKGEPLVWGDQPTPEQYNRVLEYKDSLGNPQIGTTQGLLTKEGGPGLQGAGPLPEGVGGGAPPAQGGKPSAGVSTGPAPIETASIAGAAEIPKQLNDAVAASSNLLQIQDEMKNVMSQTRQGGGQQLRTELAKMAQFFSDKNLIPDSIVSYINGGPLPASQVVDKFSVQYLMNQVDRQVANSGSKILKTEVEANKPAVPTGDMDPRAIEELFNWNKRVFNRLKEQQDQFNTFKKSGGDISDWPARWRQTQERMGWLGNTAETHEAQAPSFNGPAPKAAEPPASTFRAPPPEAIEILRKNPTTRAQFEKRFGPADKYLK